MGGPITETATDTSQQFWRDTAAGLMEQNEQLLKAVRRAMTRLGDAKLCQPAPEMRPKEIEELYELLAAALPREATGLELIGTLRESQSVIREAVKRLDEFLVLGGPCHLSRKDVRDIHDLLAAALSQEVSNG